MKETVEARAVSIAAYVLEVIGVRIHESPADCHEIKEWLLSKAEEELSIHESSADRHEISELNKEDVFLEPELDPDMPF